MKKCFEVIAYGFGSNLEATPSDVVKSVKRCTALSGNNLQSFISKVEALSIGEKAECFTMMGEAFKVTRLENFNNN